MKKLIIAALISFAALMICNCGQGGESSSTTSPINADVESAPNIITE